MMDPSSAVFNNWLNEELKLTIDTASGCCSTGESFVASWPCSSRI